MQAPKHVGFLHRRHSGNCVYILPSHKGPCKGVSCVAGWTWLPTVHTLEIPYLSPSFRPRIYPAADHRLFLIPSGGQANRRENQTSGTGCALSQPREGETGFVSVIQESEGLTTGAKRPLQNSSLFCTLFNVDIMLFRSPLTRAIDVTRYSPISYPDPWISYAHARRNWRLWHNPIFIDDFD